MNEPKGSSPIAAGRAFRRASAPSVKQLPLSRAAFAAAMFADFLFELRGDDQIAQIGGFNLHGADVAVAFGLVAFVVAKPGLGRLNIAKLLVILIAGLVTFSFLRGVVADSFAAAIVFRTRAVTLLFIFYATLSGERLEPINRFAPMAVYLIWIYAGLFCLRMVYGPTLFLSPDSAAFLNVDNLEYRSLNSETILVLGLVLVLLFDTILRNKSGGRHVQYITATFLALCIIALSRQRTSSLAVLLGLLTYIGCEAKLRRYRVLIIFPCALLMGVLVIAFMTDGVDDLIRLLPTAFQTSFEKTATFTGRQEVWSYAIGTTFSGWDLVRQLFGPPAGEGLYIMTVRGLWKASLHSQYVATLMNYGILGAVVWGSLILTGLIAALSNIGTDMPNRVGLSPGATLAWLVMLLAYGINYEWQDGAGFFVAMALVSRPVPNKHFTPSAGVR